MELGWLAHRFFERREGGGMSNGGTAAFATKIAMHRGAEETRIK